MPKTTPFDALRSTIAAVAELNAPGVCAPLSPQVAEALLNRALCAPAASRGTLWTCIEILRPALLDAASRDESVRARLHGFLAPSLECLHEGDWAPQSYPRESGVIAWGDQSPHLVSAVDLFLSLGGSITPGDAERLIALASDSLAEAPGCRIVHHPSFPIRLLPKLLGEHWKSYRSSCVEAFVILTSGPRVQEFLAHQPTRKFLAKRIFGGSEPRYWPVEFAPSVLWAATMQPNEWPIVLEGIGKAMVFGWHPWEWDTFLAAISAETMSALPEEHPILARLRQPGPARSPLTGGLARLAGAPEPDHPGAVVVGRA